MTIKKIISGGQRGVEEGALDAAIKYYFPHGGWIIKDRQTGTGPLPDTYNLREMSTVSYEKCIERNVTYSDGL